MSKRKRDGAVLVTNHRHVPRPPTPDLLTAISAASSGSSLSSDSFEQSRKRPYSETCEISSFENARKRPWAPHDIQRGQKRNADFDFEIERLHKRLKATTPSAEEAIGFLLPHLLEMRRLYLSERQKVIALEEDNNTLKKNNAIITQTLRDQLTKKNLIQRQLDLALYRLSLIRDQNSF